MGVYLRNTLDLSVLIQPEIIEGKCCNESMP